MKNKPSEIDKGFYELSQKMKNNEEIWIENELSGLWKKRGKLSWKAAAKLYLQFFYNDDNIQEIHQDSQFTWMSIGMLEVFYERGFKDASKRYLTKEQYADEIGEKSMEIEYSARHFNFRGKEHNKYWTINQRIPKFVK
jgi:hypothetical protein